MTPETVALLVSLCYLKQCIEENVNRTPGLTMYIIPQSSTLSILFIIINLSILYIASQTS